MKRKNVLLAGLASVALLTTGCGKITATFPEKDSALTNTTIELDNNTLNVIYKTIKDNDSFKSDVKELLTREIAAQVLGTFSVEETSTGYNIVSEYDKLTSETEKNEWIKKHPAYNNWSHTGYKLTLDDENAPTIDQFEKRLNTVKKIIDKQIVISMWSEANSSSYKRNNRFYEVLFARSIYEKLYNIKYTGGNTETDNNDKIEEVLYTNPTYKEHYIETSDEKFNGLKDKADDTATGFTVGALIDGRYDTNTDEGIENIKSILHINHYLDYVNNSILPGITTKLLIEQYILQEQYSAIGNTQSRSVNFIKIANNVQKNGDKFVKSFVEKYFTGTNEADINKTTNEKYEIAEVAWKSVIDEVEANPASKSLATEIFGAAKTDNPSKDKDGHEGGKYIENYGDNRPFNYYINTPYYNLVKQYSTLTNDPQTNDSTNYSTFTSIDSINYSPIEGFAIKTDGIRIEDYTTESWQTKDSSSLPDAAKNKLYSYGLVNEWNSATQTNKNGNTYLGSFIYQNEKDSEKRSFLMKDTYSSRSDSITWQDGDNFYLIELKDVITPEEISITSGEGSEATSEADKVVIEEKARTAAYTLASGSTYTTNALTFFLKQCNISYHDQDVYDYFVDNFPNLFED